MALSMELDIGFEEQKLAVELDGFRYHSSPEATRSI